MGYSSIKETEMYVVYSKNKQSKHSIERLLKALYKLQVDYKDQQRMYLTKASCRRLQVGLAFSFSKSSYENVTKVKELLSLLDQQNKKFLTKEEIIPYIKGIVQYVNDRKEDYDQEEIHYLLKCLSPLFFQENRKSKRGDLFHEGKKK